MKLIPLTRGLFAQVDDDMFEELNKIKWYAGNRGRGSGFVAAHSILNPKKGTILMHRIIMNAPRGANC